MEPGEYEKDIRRLMQSYPSRDPVEGKVEGEVTVMPNAKLAVVAGTAPTIAFSCDASASRSPR